MRNNGESEKLMNKRKPIHTKTVHIIPITTNSPTKNGEKLCYGQNDWNSTTVLIIVLIIEVYDNLTNFIRFTSEVTVLMCLKLKVNQSMYKQTKKNLKGEDIIMPLYGP